jgi:hypothetical protein
MGVFVNKLTRRLLLSGLAALMLTTAIWRAQNTLPAHAATGLNQQINFQGKLVNTNGTNIPDGTYNIEFKIYQDGDGVVGGADETLKWTETRLRNSSQGVTVTNGIFQANLGSVNPFGSSIDWDQDTIWLSINLGNTNATCTPFSNCSPDGEMSPMIRFTASPYALNSAKLQGLNKDQFVQLAQGLQADSSTTNASIAINKTGGTANILQLQRGGADVLIINNAGQLTFKPQTDDASAFKVQKADGSVTVLNVDTTNARVGINTAAPTADLSFGAGANRIINVLTQPTANTAGNKLTVQSGTGNGTGAGGDLVLQAGGGGATNAGGGNLYAFGGAATGTGTNGNVILAHNGTSAVGNVGVGTTTPGSKLTVIGSLADASGSVQQLTASLVTNNAGTYNQNGLSVTTTSAGADTQNGSVHGINNSLSLTSGEYYGPVRAINNELILGGSLSVQPTVAVGQRTFVDNNDSASPIDNLYGSQINVEGLANNTYGLDILINPNSSSGNIYGLNVDVVGGATNAYGLYINDLDADATPYGIYQVGANDYNYFAGNVGIGDDSPNSLFTVGNNDLFQINSSGQIGAQTAPLSDYLFSLAGSTANDYSRVIDITQANDSNENSTVINIANTANTGTLSAATRNIYNMDLSLTPTATLSTATAATLNTAGIKQTVNLNNVTLGNSGTSDVNTLNAYGNQTSLTGSPVYNDTALNDQTIFSAYGHYSSVSLIPTLTSVRSNSTFDSYGGYFNNNSGSAGDANLVANSYGIYALASGGLTTTGNTAHYGGYFGAGGTADNNYGVYIGDITGAINNYSLYSSGTANSYFAGNVGIGTTEPGNKLSINSLTTANSLAQVAIATGTATNKGLIIQGATSQTANLLEIEGSDGSDMVTFTPTATGAIDDRNVFTIGAGGGGTFTGVELKLSSANTFTSPRIQFINGGGSPAPWYISKGIASGNNGSFYDGLWFTQDTTPRMVINSSGNVGIGTTGPDSKLHVVGGGACIEQTDSACVAASGSLVVNGPASGDALTVSNDGSTGNIVNFKDNATSVLTLSDFGRLTLSPIASTSGTPTLLTVTAPAHTGLTASTEAVDVNLNLARTVQFATGALTTQRALVVQAPTYGFVGASTITDAATAAITGAPAEGTNATITNSHALLVQGGAATGASNAYGLTINTPTGATNNYAAAFMGGNVGIGTATPAHPLTVFATAPNITDGRIVDIDGTLSSSTNDQAAIKTSPTVAPTSASARVYNGGIFNVSGNNNSHLTNATFRGVDGNVSYSGSSGTLGTAAGGRYRVNNTSTGTITNARTLIIASPGNSGTLTNTHGLYIESQTIGTQTTTPFGLYQAGSGDLNYFAGNVGIGNTGPTAALHVTAPNGTSGGTGTAGTTGLIVTGGNGGNSSTASTAGGAGGAITLTAGNGGNSTGVAGTNGANITLQGGAGGTGSTAGSYGNIVMQASGGNVGIGTAAPGAKLDVQGNLRVSGSGSQLEFSDIAAGSIPNIKSNISTSTLDITGGLGGTRILNNAGSEVRLFVKENGNVGIGTIDPQGILHTVASGAKTTNYSGNLLTNTATSSIASINKYGLEVRSTGTWNGTSANNIGLYVSSVTGGTNNYDAIFNGGGNVGIGTTGPGAKLDISNATSANTATGFQVQSTFAPTAGGTQTNFTSTVTNAPTSLANTVVGQSLTVNDSTALANTIQGINLILNDTGSAAKTVRGLLVDTSGTTNASANITAALFKGTTTTNFLVQDSSGTELLRADTTNMILKVGTTIAPTLSGAKLLVTNSEVTTALRVGNGTNGLDFASGTRPSSSNPFFKGSSQPSKRITLTPEYPGAVMTAPAANNIGSMTSDFCSATARLNVNTAICNTAGDEHNYYSWTTTNSMTAQHYDIYVRYQVPSDFAAFTSSTAIQMHGWRDSTSQQVLLSLYRADGTICGTADKNVATWTSSTVYWTQSDHDGDETACSIAAGDRIVFKIRLTALNGGYARAGQITFDYYSNF